MYFYLQTSSFVVNFYLLNKLKYIFFVIGELSRIYFFSDPPKIVSIGRERVKTATLFSSTNFECLGEGNPTPTYQWIQKRPSPSDSTIERGRDAKLYISNVTYDFQGEYRCKVTNIIKGEERSEISEPIILQVHGEDYTSVRSKWVVR